MAYNTTKNIRSVNRYIKEISNSVSNRDGRITKNIVEGGINIPFLLKNIKYILGDNKITGISDLSIKKPVTSVDLSVYKDTITLSITSITANQSYSGIEALANRVYRFKSNNWKNCIDQCNGSIWAFNYWKLSKGYDKLDE